jgi:hypothetical protein
MNEHIILLEKYNINSDELLFVTMILLIQDGEEYDFINRYFNLPLSCRNGIRELLISLQDKGIITKEYKIPNKGDKFIPEDITFNKNFVKRFYKSSFDIGKELFEEYPMFGIINGNPVGIRSISKKFDSLEDFYRFYGKSISWNPEKHSEIIELVKWGKENNLIVCSLANFIIDQKWNELEALKQGDIANINYDAVKLL